ncbi:hypothetical protein E2C01_092299 [Portunus trituberculatus]|uniref:Uncharacterized protein n=1 Tax=Portunus trituberculatus TaxID=210409 RepID=A0A5B7JLE1_PORTR|nr:hypothetical protein [Portunus trituberculatus]
MCKASLGTRPKDALQSAAIFVSSSLRPFMLKQGRLGRGRSGEGKAPSGPTAAKSEGSKTLKE